MPIDSLVLALIGHLVGDYLLQNDWMALNKKKQHLPCLVHCFIWALCVCGFAGFGWIAFLSLFAIPVAQYPDIVPPQVSVTTTYPGASAAIVDGDGSLILPSNRGG